MKHTLITLLVLLSLWGCSNTTGKLSHNELREKTAQFQDESEYDYPDPHITVDDIISMQIIHIDSYENYTIHNKYTPSDDDTRYPVTNKIHIATINDILQKSLRNLQNEPPSGVDKWTEMIVEIELKNEKNPLGFGLSKKVTGNPLLGEVWCLGAFFTIDCWQDLFDVLSEIGLPVKDFEIPESGEDPRRFR